MSVEDPWRMADRITAAGSVFIGHYSPESAGDYASGTNHTLPTCGWAASYSGVNIDSFMRKMTLQELTPEGLRTLSRTIVTMAGAEGLDAHANAVRVRLEGEQTEAGEAKLTEEAEARNSKPTEGGKMGEGKKSPERGTLAAKEKEGKR